MRRARGRVVEYCSRGCARPTGDSHGRTTRDPAQRTNGQSAGRATVQTFGTVALAVDDGATFARNSVDHLDLFPVLADDEMADEDGAVHASTGAQAVETGVVRLYGVVVILAGWVRGSRCRLTLAA